MNNTSRQRRYKSLYSALKKIGIDISRYAPRDWSERAFNHLLKIRGQSTSSESYEAADFLIFCVRHAADSNAQLFQDLFIRYSLKEKREGFFVEFGATDGISLSNTKSLEEHLAWRGILAEPARCWHDRLHRNRSCVIDTRCVWIATGQTLQFNEVEVAELSTVQSFSDRDLHAVSRQQGHTYDVETISLNDLLSVHSAPKHIDYLSIDTEGSELSILESFDFDKHHIGIITVEHNYTPDREKLFTLLTEKGFHRKFTEFSKWDDWYVNGSL